MAQVGPRGRDVPAEKAPRRDQGRPWDGRVGSERFSRSQAASASPPVVAHLPWIGPAFMLHVLLLIVLCCLPALILLPLRFLDREPRNEIAHEQERPAPERAEMRLAA